MLIYTPNQIPTSLKEKFSGFIPSVRFIKAPKDFTLYKDVPGMDLESKPPRIIHTRVYTKRSFLEISFFMRHFTRNCYGSGYTGDYTKHVTVDGLKILLHFGKQKEPLTLCEYSPVGGYGLGGEYGNLSFSNNQRLRNDLDNLNVQNFIIKMLEEKLQQELQLSL